MKEEYRSFLRTALQDIPDGTFRIEKHNILENNKTPFPIDRLDTQINGKGKIERFLLFPGIEVALHQYLAGHIHFQHLPPPLFWKSIIAMLDGWAGICGTALRFIWERGICACIQCNAAQIQK